MSPGGALRRIIISGANYSMAGSGPEPRKEQYVVTGLQYDKAGGGGTMRQPLLEVQPGRRLHLLPMPWTSQANHSEAQPLVVFFRQAPRRVSVRVARVDNRKLLAGIKHPVLGEASIVNVTFEMNQVE